MEKNIKLSHILKPIYFIVFAILLELVNFLWLGFTITGNPNALQVLPKYFFLDLGVYIIVAGAIFISSKEWLENLFFYLFIGFQLFINMVNATLYKVFGDIFSPDMVKLGAEAVSAFKFEFIDFWSIIVNFLILGAIITTQVLLDKKLKVAYKMPSTGKKAIVILTFFLCFISGSCAYGFQTLGFYDTQTSVRVSESDKYLWDNMQFKLEAYKKFGTYGFYLRSLSNIIYKPENFDQNTREDILLGLEDSKQDVDVTAPLYGDNLIVVMLESFEWFAIDPFNTPTLWDIRNNLGVSMENYYSKNKTNVSEDIVLLGNMPKDSSMSALAKSGNLNTPYTLPNLFKSQGYMANFFHSFKGTFYDRDVVNAGMGFEHVYALEDAEIENKSTSFNDWNLDSDIAKYYIDEIMPTDKKFFSFFTTVTTHGTYNRTNERFEPYYTEYDSNKAEYKAWLEENTSYIYPEEGGTLEKCFRQYKCAAMDTDRMIAFLLSSLEERGLKDSTTLIMYADHNCYYEDIYFNIKGTSKADYYDIYNYNVPFMIYSSKLVSGVKNDFCNTYDIYPTICSLFGLPYNSYMTQGYSIYSKDIRNSVMVSYLSGAFNENFYTLNIVDMHVSPTATEVNMRRFKRNACRFYERQYNIELIYKYSLAGYFAP